MKIGCQTITFGNERHKTDWQNIIKSVALSGYDGMEVGFFRLNPDEAEDFKKCQKDNNITQAAIHIGGDFSDVESVKKQLENIHTLIKTAHILECENIFVSGSPSVKDYKSASENLNKLGKLLNGNGLVLSYHNHDWEIKSECCEHCCGLYDICDNTDPQYVSFVPDIGWVNRGGKDPVTVLKRLGDRVSNLHFKEFTSDGSFTELGEGVVDFKDVYDFVKGRDFWIVAEQDASLIGAEESVARNFEYIKNLIVKK